ncbi:MAG TPA: amidohydrolase family protein [Chloroflexota bacterium]|nr:amidohydrolase family protein [Chloroflexota bacterium]
MIVDANAHIGHWPFRRLHTTTVEGLLRMLDRAGIDRAVVAHTHALFYRDAHEANAELHAAVAPHRDRLIPLATLNPEYAGWRDDLAECVDEWGMRGLRLYPTYHRYDLAGDAAAELLAEAEARGLPVSIPCGFEDPRQRHHLDTAPDLTEHPIAFAAARFPHARFLVTNVPLTTIDMIVRHLPAQDNVAFDVSALPGPEANASRRAYELLGARRLLLGTHAPFKYPEVGLLRIAAIGAPDDDRCAMLGQNAARLFGHQET